MGAPRRRCLPLLGALLAMSGWPLPSLAQAPDAGARDAGLTFAQIQLPDAGQAELTAAWGRFRKAFNAGDRASQDAARAELVKLKGDLGLPGIEPFSVGLVRAAQARQKAEDAAGALDLALDAVELSPSLPYAHLGLAGANFNADPADLGRSFAPLWAALAQVARDPRALRPALADLGAGALLALLATAAVVAFALFARWVRYFLHDFHHLLPRAAARWQSAAAAALLLALPIVFRQGVVVVLFALLLAVSLYLSLREKVVAAVLFALLGVLPYGASFLARETAFAGTLAEDVLTLERGGHDEFAALERLRRRASEERAGYPELLALGRYELVRGRIEPALAHLQAAVAIRVGDSRAMTNLGNALAAKGDLEGAAGSYQEALKTEPSLAAAHYNLGRVLELQAAALPPETALLMMDRVRSELSEARRLDPELESKEPPADLQLNRFLLSPALDDSHWAGMVDPGFLPEKLQAQLGRQLLGNLELPLASGLPLLLMMALFGLSTLKGRVGSSRACPKCGRPVCRRCDPELGRGSELCHQCVNVFARKGVVPPPLKVRKEAEVARHRGWIGRIALVLSLFCSGAGHLFSGLPVRGALYAYLFLFVVVTFFFRDGVMRPVYADPAFAFKAVILGLVFLAVYLLPLRGLSKRQSE